MSNYKKKKKIQQRIFQIKMSLLTNLFETITKNGLTIYI